ncbi:MAG TPA: outer membrane beta-barrel protein, partial [Candidatus Sulfotelmatobacter sp.]|nr:outer membrane beta-barrel protein [Candidatus Sulfotelmatobacter sp.]
MTTVNFGLRKALRFAALPGVLILSLTMVATQRGVAQTRASAPTNVAPAPEPDSDKAVGAGNGGAAPDLGISPALAKQLAAMQAEIDELKAELRGRAPAANAAAAAPAPAAAPAAVPEPKPVEAAAVSAAGGAAQGSGQAEKLQPTAPFAYADWTWLNGNPRNKDVVWDSKFFTPEIRMDIHYIEDLNHPKDDTMGGSTEIFRSNEIQIEQISFGGNFHWQNVNARILTMNGMFGVTTPRNDASAGRGQWDLRGAYKYVSEANAGYHWDVNHGLNLDAGIFVSYIGLFSYYNFDNWSYQPSYVSSNTPWFFNGVRIQWF